MTTPPRVSDDDAAEAIARITRRHERTDHPNQHLLTDDPRDVLLYLRRCGHARLLEDDESHDLEDGLLLRTYLWWQGELVERQLLDMAEALRFDRCRAGRPLGVKSGQGLVDRLYRKRALFDVPGRPVPSEKRYRSYRTEQTAAWAAVADPVTTAAPGRPAAGAETTALRAALADLIRLRDDLDEDLADTVTGMRREASDRFAEMPGAALANNMRVIAREMRGRGWSPAVQEVLDRVLTALKM